VVALADEWVGRPMATAPSVDELVLRYLAAFGPATPADVQTWSWLTGIRPILERLRPRLRTFRDETGRELFDVPDGPLPDPETPAPVRYLPLYDNIFLSHADRSRIADPRYKAEQFLKGWFTVDGFLAGAWQVERDGATATLRLLPVAPITRPHQKALRDEGGLLLAFIDPAATTRRFRFD
jgi:hypothetical protein